MQRLVLVVDDDAAFRDLALRSCARWPARRRRGGRSPQARQPPRSCARRRVLVDVGLPDGDGLELAQRIAALPWSPRVVHHVLRRRRGHGRCGARPGAVGFLLKTELANGSLRELLTGVP